VNGYQNDNRTAIFSSFSIYLDYKFGYNCARAQKSWDQLNRCMANLGFNWQKKCYLALYLSVAITLLLPAALNAKQKNTTPINPTNPLNLGPIANYTRPVRNIISIPHPTEGKEVKAYSTASPPSDWTFTLLGGYQFSNDRSRVGEVSLNGYSGIIDFAASNNCSPWTSIDISYMYTHFSGTSPDGTDQTGSQNVGSLRVLQPIPLWEGWAPAYQSKKSCNHQVAVMLSANYGDAFFKTNLPQSSSIRSSSRTFLGNALLDYQFTWFKDRKPDDKSQDAGRKKTDFYPSLLIEASTGIQFSTTRLHSGGEIPSTTSSGQQLTYQGIGCVTYSFSCGFGLLAAAEWDAPLNSDPLAGSQPFYANTAVFTGGLVYNIYAYRNKDEKNLSPWSASLLYSYTAFNPLVETNQVQLQFSYSFF
jgi:hypothetical protein